MHFIFYCKNGVWNIWNVSNNALLTCQIGWNSDLALLYSVYAKYRMNFSKKKKKHNQLSNENVRSSETFDAMWNFKYYKKCLIIQWNTDTYFKINSPLQLCILWTLNECQLDCRAASISEKNYEGSSYLNSSEKQTNTHFCVVSKSTLTIVSNLCSSCISST